MGRLQLPVPRQGLLEASVVPLEAGAPPDLGRVLYQGATGQASHHQGQGLQTGSMSEYPEHDKLAEVAKFSQKIGEFLEWAETEGILLCGHAEPEDYYQALTPIREPRNSLLARYFEIDLGTLEAEKLQMLQEQRDMNVRVAAEEFVEQYGDTIKELGEQ